MARYVDIEKAEYPYLSMSMFGINSKDCKIYNEGVKATEDMIQALPTADVVEVKHGHWLNIGFEEYWCSVCDANGEDVLVKRGNPDHKYCPHCGAKMDAK